MQGFIAEKKAIECPCLRALTARDKRDPFVLFPNCRFILVQLLQQLTLDSTACENFVAGLTKGRKSFSDPFMLLTMLT